MITLSPLNSAILILPDSSFFSLVALLSLLCFKYRRKARARDGYGMRVWLRMRSPRQSGAKKKKKKELRMETRKPQWLDQIYALGEWTWQQIKSSEEEYSSKLPLQFKCMVFKILLPTVTWEDKPWEVMTIVVIFNFVFCLWLHHLS